MEAMTLEEFEDKLNKRSRLEKFLTRTKYRIKYFIDIPYHIDRIKWFIQRGRRGYSDCDVWDLYAYLLDVLIPSLEQLQRTKHSYPYYLGENEDDAMQKWTNELQEIIDGFKAAKEMGDPMMGVEKKDYEKRYKELVEIFNNGMELFRKRFFQLWD